MADGRVLGDSGVQPPHHPDGDSEAPEGRGLSQTHMLSLVPRSAFAPPTAGMTPSHLPPESSPPPPTPHPRLTLQFLVPSSPLEADGCCPLVDEALEAGVLALLHGAAGRVDGNDGAPEACGTRQAGGWAREGRLGMTPLPQLRGLPSTPRPWRLPHSR